MMPRVSIACTTYNHAPYIRQCLDGFLMQKTSFSYEVIIHDDASDDGTQQIIAEYTLRYPDMIFPMYQQKNQYSQGVRGMMFRFNFPRCRGRYIALCEGDDYWTDPYKLQKQVDILEANPDIMMSVGRVQFLYQDTQKLLPKKEFVQPEFQSIYTLADYLKQPFSQTSSFLFRNRQIPMPDWMSEVIAGDQCLMVLMTGADGKIYFHKDEFSVYRVNQQSVTQSNILRVLKNNRLMFNHWDKQLAYRFHGLIKSRLWENQLLIILFSIPGMQQLYKKYWFEQMLQFVYKAIMQVKNYLWPPKYASARRS